MLYGIQQPKINQYLKWSCQKRNIYTLFVVFDDSVVLTTNEGVGEQRHPDNNKVNHSIKFKCFRCICKLKFH